MNTLLSNEKQCEKPVESFIIYAKNLKGVYLYLSFNN